MDPWDSPDHVVFHTSKAWRWTMVAVLIGLSLLGLWLKWIMFHYLHSCGFKRPVDMLLLTEEIASAALLITTCHSVIGLIMEQPIGSILGEAYCRLYVFYILLTLQISFLGNCAQTFFRITYIHLPGMVGCVGERLLAYVYILAVVALGLGLAIPMASAHLTTGMDYNFCMGFSEKQAAELLRLRGLHDESQSLQVQIPLIMVISLGVLNALSFALFIAHMVKRDNSLTQLILDNEQVGQRNRKNAMTMTSHLCGSALQLLVMGVALSIINSSLSEKLVGLFTPCVNVFCASIIPFCQMMMVPALRRIVLNRNAAGERR